MMMNNTTRIKELLINNYGFDLSETGAFIDVLMDLMRLADEQDDNFDLLVQTARKEYEQEQAKR
jgi:hypothetical protein